MANAASVVERIYKAIKADICTGVILPGERITIAAYEDRFRVSKSPIRNALYKLDGEGLVESHPHEGFFRPRMLEQTLNDILLWTENALNFAFDLIETEQNPQRAIPPLPDNAGDLVTGIEDLFSAVAAFSGNARCYREINALNAQLRPIRLQEPAQLTGLDSELADLTEAWHNADLVLLRQRVHDYYVLRQQTVRQLVGLSYHPMVNTPARSIADRI